MNAGAKSPVSRRAFFGQSAVLAGAAALGFGALFGARPAAAADGDDVPTMLNLAATAETFACTHYYLALTSKIKFTDPQLAYIRAALQQEQIHLEYLNANGGKALAEKFFFPVGTFASRQSFALVSSIAETVFVAAYLAAVRRFAELGQPLLAATAAQVAVIEGQHLALVRETALELPNNIPLGEAKYNNVSDAGPTLKPVLDGSNGALGPMDKTAIAYPGPDAIRKITVKSTLNPAKPFTDPTLFSASGANLSATMAATQQ